MRVIDQQLAVHDTRLARGTVVPAPPGVVYEAATRADLVKLWRRDPVVRLLIAGRAVPDTIARRLRGKKRRPAAPASMTPASLPSRGEWIRLAEEPGRELVLGAVGRFWTPRIEWRDTAADEFAQFWEPGWGKIAAAVRVEPVGENQTVLTCETRTAATDPLSGLGFRRYWLLARPGVWLILGRLLRSIRRDAEARVALEPARHGGGRANRQW